MYSSRLKHSVEWAAVVPQLASSSGLALREARLDSHDLSISITTSRPSTTAPLSTFPNDPHCQSFRAVLLTLEDVKLEKQATLLHNLQRLQYETGGVNIAAVFLLEDPERQRLNGRNDLTVAHREDTGISQSCVHAYTELQRIIVHDPRLGAMPVLPLAHASALTNLLREHIHTLSAGIAPAAMAIANEPCARSLDLVAHCTSGAPAELLDRHTVYLLTDVVGSVAELAAASLSATARRRVEEALEGETAQEVVESLWEFWREEWTVE